MCTELVPIIHTRENCVPDLHMCDEYLINSSHVRSYLHEKFEHKSPLQFIEIDHLLISIFASMMYWYHFFLWVSNLECVTFTVQQTIDSAVRAVCNIIRLTFSIPAYDLFTSCLETCEG